MPHKSYQEVISWLFEQFPSYQLIGSKAYKPTLENVRKLCELIGNPESRLKTVHIAGSNGKGSVSSMLASSLTEAGIITGLFTSPHIKDFRERIRVNGEMISETDVVAFVEMVQQTELDFSPSFFEITFAMALWYFERKGVEIAVIETGLGGRLDATNIVEPTVTAITSISLEHTQILGSTIQEIAFEKAGIIKQGIPMVISEKLDPIASEVIRNKSIAMNAELIISKALAIPGKNKLYPQYQESNFGIVKSIINFLMTKGTKISEENIIAGIDNIGRNTGFRGRMEYISFEPNVILDVSHNPDGIKNTIDSIIRILPKEADLHLIYGSSSDKDLLSIKKVLPSNALCYLTSFNHPRSASIEQLKEAFGEEQFKGLHFFENPKEAYNMALNAANQHDTILVFGSFFLLEDFF